MHKAWNCKEEVPYCFSRSYVKFQGHTALKIVEFDPNWAFPDCNSSLNSPMAMKCCTKLETAKERCPIVFPRSSIKFQGHTGQNIADFDPNWAFPDYRPVAAFKSLRFALFTCRYHIILKFSRVITLDENAIHAKKVKVKCQGHRGQSKSCPNLRVSGP